MTKTMRLMLDHLASSPEMTSYAYMHRNTRAALERRGYAVRLGGGLYGITTLGVWALKG